MDYKKKIGIIVGVVVIAISLVATIVLLTTGGSPLTNDTTNSTPSVESTKTTNQTSTTTTTPIENPKGNWKNLDDMKKSAVDSVESLLKLSMDVNKNSGEDYTKFLAELSTDSDYASKLPDNFKNSFYIPEGMNPDSKEGTELASYVAVLHMSYVANVAVTKMGNDSIKPLTDNSWQLAYGDLKLQRVFVPLRIFMGSMTNFDFEMIYIDGEWKLDPYSFLSEILIANSVMNAAQSGSTNSSNIPSVPQTTSATGGK